MGPGMASSRCSPKKPKDGASGLLPWAPVPGGGLRCTHEARRKAPAAPLPAALDGSGTGAGADRAPRLSRRRSWGPKQLPRHPQSSRASGGAGCGLKLPPKT